MSQISVKNGMVVLDQLNQFASSKNFCDIQETFQRFSLDTIGELAFGVEIGSLKSKVPFAISFDNANKAVVERSFHPFYRMWFLNWLLPYTSIDNHLKKAIKTLDEFSYRVIRERKTVEDLEEREDILSRYLCTTDDEGNKFSEKYIRDAMINLILAGRDSASQLVTWTAYLLSQNPEKEKKLLQELDQELRGETPSLHNVKNLKYLRAVLDETLRIWPPVPIERKYALEDDRLPDGTFIPKGTVVVWSVWTMGRMSEFWDQPMEFLPERWLETDNAHNPAFIPFLIGPRTCLGQNMAYLQAKILLCLLYQKFTFSHVPHHVVTYDSAITLKARYGMEMYIHRRS
jgi:cytochrome P450